MVDRSQFCPLQASPGMFLQCSVLDDLMKDQVFCLIHGVLTCKTCPDVYPVYVLVE